MFKKHLALSELLAGTALVIASTVFIAMDVKIADQALWPFTVTMAACGLVVYGKRIWRARLAPAAC